MLKDLPVTILTVSLASSCRMENRSESLHSFQAKDQTEVLLNRDLSANIYCPQSVEASCSLQALLG